MWSTAANEEADSWVPYEWKEGEVSGGAAPCSSIGVQLHTSGPGFAPDITRSMRAGADPSNNFSG
jgi:hypothetical protein